MKKSIVNNKPAAAGLLFLVIAFVANAQKLPNVQQTSLRAPSNIKIDGKATEWDNKFQAYNHATDIFYTISNDDEHLYLTVQATDPQVIKHIISAGITFTIRKSGKKNDKDNISISYPVFDKNNKPVIYYKREFEAVQGSPLWTKQNDSLIAVNNKNLGDKSKNIRVMGIKDLDSLISVYNEDGIKAAALFDNKMAYTYELSVSLQQLGLSVKTPVMFAYHVRLNEVAEHGINITKDDAGNITAINILKGAERGQDPTDFWGEYTLARQ